MRLHFLNKDHIDEMVSLTKELNPNLSIDILKERHEKMFSFQNYQCFGMYENEKLIALSSGWITVKLYSGKQLEIDNVIVDPSTQSKGYGNIFIDLIEDWARKEDCETVELNAYSANGRAHKFYYKRDYQIVGFHFQKKI
ncbi:GNAT family N-acetyltransferase [Aquimarina sp. 2201CG1-2-11]|uniref:GNAT family N-acetyltransferase n=1 Tax=Aquimarina discodermiae TaxID=3231043 RepID=UPI0034633BB8